MPTPRIDCYISSTVGAVVVGSLCLIASLIGAIFPIISLCKEYPIEGQYFLFGFYDFYILAFCLGVAMTSSSMMYGAIKEKHAFMFPWLATIVGSTVANLCFIVAVVICYVTSNRRSETIHDFSVMFGIATAVCTLTTVLGAVVYNHYKQLLTKKPTQSAHPYTMSDPTMSSPIIYQKM